MRRFHLAHSHHLKPISPILWVSIAGLKIIDANHVDITQVGEKAFGLATLPKQWTLPFFVVSDELFVDYTKDQSDNNLLSKWGPAISSAAKQCRIESDDQIIVRSNSYSEGLENRGKFISVEGTLREWPQLVKRCFDDFITQEGSVDVHMPVIIQKRVVPLSCGHISNERRVAEETRDWRGEFDTVAPPRIFSISLRNWRKKVNTTNQLDSMLKCPNDRNIPNVLTIPCTWATEQGIRIHFEWVYDGNYLYVVQADEEKTSTGIDPTKISYIKTNNEIIDNHFPHCLHILKAEDAKRYQKYAKIQNPLLYHRLGLATATLYILDNKSILKSLTKGIVPPDLELDLKILTSQLLIIRTDIATNEKEERQLLPRTDGITNVDEAIKWLCNSCKQLSKKSYRSPIFIFHNYIPAFSSAFAYASPDDKLVRIEALWGLPEGLYYYSHDKYLVDTKVLDIKKISCENFDVQDLKNYKKYFVFPMNDGQWTVQCLKPPYDWNAAIPDESWIRQIAYITRQISTEEQKSISVMWFVGVDRQQYSCDVFPWYHEQYEYTDNLRMPRNKLSFERAITIHTLKDLEKLEKIKQTSTPNIRNIQIQPTNANFLRDRKIIDRIGIAAKGLGANILLEGGILSHAYYQLIRTGAKVEVRYSFESKKNHQLQFNKLVRDKIPEKIEKNGEEAITAQLNKELFTTLLKRKLVEEALEVLDSKNNEDVITELADILEVFDGILHQYQIDFKTILEYKEKKRKKSGGFEKGIYLKKTTNRTISGEGRIIVDKSPLDDKQTISKSTDLRRYPNANESLTRIKVPITLDRWEVHPRVKADNIDVVLRGERRQGNWQIEISIFEEAEQLSFFDE